METYGHVQQKSGRVSHAKTNISYAKATVKAGRPEVFLSVLMPFNEGEDAAKLARKIKTSVGRRGDVVCTSRGGAECAGIPIIDTHNAITNFLNPSVIALTKRAALFVGPLLMHRRQRCLPSSHDPVRNWFDAPAWDYAWWQKKPRRVTVYIHPAEGQTYGAVQQATSFDISREIRTNNSFAKATVKAGEPTVFLSVLLPHDARILATGLVDGIETSVARDGTAAAEVVLPACRARVTIAPDGTWSVERRGPRRR